MDARKWKGSFLEHAKYVVLSDHIISMFVCVRVCVTEGHRKCIDLQPNATASLDDGDCGSHKGRPVR